MNRKKIWGNTIVKNEDKFIWFAIISVIDYLDKILVWDTSSSDKTVEIIQLLKKKYPKKIDFQQIGPVDKTGLTKARQEMLKLTKSDWFMIVDGDEIWWQDSIKKTVKLIEEQNDLYALVHPVINVVGDIFHFQEEQAGQYQILGRKGHFNIRVINRKIPGLSIKGDYPNEGFYDKDQRLLQNIESKLKFIDAPILHMTHLSRSSNQADKTVLERTKKLKHEIGNRFRDDYKFPEVLYKGYPTIVESPWITMSPGFKLRSYLETPLRKVNRRTIFLRKIKRRLT